MADLSTFASAAAARSEIVTDPGGSLQGIENGNGSDITNRIVSQGSNSDGEWIRYASGLQICTRTARLADDAGYTQMESTGLYRTVDDINEGPTPQPFSSFFYRGVSAGRRTGTGWSAGLWVCAPSTSIDSNTFPESFVVVDRDLPAGYRTWEIFQIVIGEY